MLLKVAPNFNRMLRVTSILLRKIMSLRKILLSGNQPLVGCVEGVKSIPESVIYLCLKAFRTPCFAKFTLAENNSLSCSSLQRALGN